MTCQVHSPKLASYQEATLETSAGVRIMSVNYGMTEHLNTKKELTV